MKAHSIVCLPSALINNEIVHFSPLCNPVIENRCQHFTHNVQEGDALIIAWIFLVSRLMNGLYYYTNNNKLHVHN